MNAVTQLLQAIIEFLPQESQPEAMILYQLQSIWT